jgi:hypothetical protein
VVLYPITPSDYTDTPAITLQPIAVLQDADALIAL